MSCADQDCARYGAVGLCEHSPCSHKFMGTNTCAKCGTTSESLRAAGYGEAMRLLADAATALQRADEQVSDLRAKLGTQHAELEEVANNLHLQRHYAMSLSARYQSQGMRLSEATALLDRWHGCYAQGGSLSVETFAFLSRAPAQAEPTKFKAPRLTDEHPTIIAGQTVYTIESAIEEMEACRRACRVERGVSEKYLNRAESAESEVRELRAQLEAVREACESGMSTASYGERGMYIDRIRALLSPQAPGTEER